MEEVIAAVEAPAPPAAPVPVAPPDTAWSNRFAALGPGYYTRLSAHPFPEPHWVATSPPCARLLGLPDGWRENGAMQSLQVFSGNALWPGMEPLASVYSGHQFGVWAGQLGDGRALWLGEMATPAGPQELQLKGSGPTPYSRRADGRAVLRSSIREFLCSEAMSGLGIPTTRALCITGSPLPVFRETRETAAIVTRVATSFIRFGHFEHFAHTARDFDRLRRLADFVIDAHLPACRDEPNPYLALLRQVSVLTAELIAGWQAVGFCHGVMNTDNMSILGLTIDYGPFGFLDAFDPGHVCNHSDHQGRYAYSRQPGIARWNLYALGQALLPVVAGPDADERAFEAAGEAAVEAIEAYQPAFARALAARMRAKLGLATEQEGDGELIDALLQRMAADRADYTLVFRQLADWRPASAATAGVRDYFIDRAAFDAWAARYAARLAAEASDDPERSRRMRRVNPLYVLRNHLAEVAIRRAAEGDFAEVERVRAVLEHPYDDQPENAAYAALPPEWSQHLEVSCSS